MAQDEKYGTRNLSYSAWHRRGSIKRFVGLERAQTLSMIDVDVPIFVEYDDGTKVIIAVLETAIDCGQDNKPSTVTQSLAKQADIPAYTVLYKLAGEPNPANPKVEDIVEFRYRRIWPEPQSGWTIQTPLEWAERLIVMRLWWVERYEKKTA